MIMHLYTTNFDTARFRIEPGFYLVAMFGVATCTPDPLDPSGVTGQVGGNAPGSASFPLPDGATGPTQVPFVFQPQTMPVLSGQEYYIDAIPGGGWNGTIYADVWYALEKIG